MINQNILDELKASRDLKRMTSKNITFERYRAKTKLLEDANSELQESLDVANTEIAYLENEVKALQVKLYNANSVINDLENEIS